jgi:hypothetical protein
MVARNDRQEEPIMNKSRMLFFGALIGAITGLIAAMLLNRRAEKSEKEAALTAGEGLKLGMLVFGLLRAIASLGDER